MRTYAPHDISYRRTYASDSPQAREARCLECGQFHRYGASCASTAQDSRPRWEAKTFVMTEGRANLIKTMMAERGITAEQLVAEFPSRPASKQEFQDVLTWIRGRAASPSAPAQGGKTHTVPTLPTGKRGYGYYAIPAGVLGYTKPHFFRVKNAKGTGFQYLDEKASDNLYPVRGARRAEIMKWLAENDRQAGALYGQLIGNCRFCHKDLTDETNPYKAQGAGPDCGPKYLG